MEILSQDENDISFHKYLREFSQIVLTSALSLLKLSVYTII